MPTALMTSSGARAAYYLALNLGPHARPYPLLATMVPVIVNGSPPRYSVCGGPAANVDICIVLGDGGVEPMEAGRHIISRDGLLRVGRRRA
jgi:hypothetical protein